MTVRQRFAGKYDLRRNGSENLTDHPVSAVPYAGLAQRTIKNDFVCVGIRMLLLKELSGSFRTHCVGGRWSLANFIYLSDGLHIYTLRMHNPTKYIKLFGKLQCFIANLSVKPQGKVHLLI